MMGYGVAAAILVWVLWRLRRSAASPRKSAGKSRRLIPVAPVSYACVEIRPEGNPCRAVVRQLGVRYLRKEAPLIPLPECTYLACECYYEHFPDRRQHDRRDPFGGNRLSLDDDRRINGIDRRKAVMASPPSFRI